MLKFKTFDNAFVHTQNLSCELLPKITTLIEKISFYNFSITKWVSTELYTSVSVDVTMDDSNF